MARRLNVKRIVIHDGYVPFVYFPEWFVEQSVLFWRELLADVPEARTLRDQLAAWRFYDALRTDAHAPAPP